MRRRRPPRTERARDGYQVPIPVPVRLETSRSENVKARSPLTTVESRFYDDELAELGLEIVEADGFYRVQRRGQEVLATFRLLRNARAWIYGEGLAGCGR